MSSKIHLRRWLERSTDTDSYVVVNGTRSGKDEGWTWLDLKIADCNRNVTLSFGFTGERERKARLAKLVRLEGALAKVREELTR